MAKKSAARVLPLPTPTPRVLTVPELRGIRGTLQRLALRCKDTDLARAAVNDLALLDEAVEGAPRGT